MKTVARLSAEDRSDLFRNTANRIPSGKKDDLSEPAVQGVQYCDRLFAIERLSARLSEQEKTALLRESSESSDWIVDTIRKICLGGAA